MGCCIELDARFHGASGYRLVPMEAPITRMFLEAPGVLIEVEVEYHQGKAERDLLCDTWRWKIEACEVNAC